MMNQIYQKLIWKVQFKCNTANINGFMNLMLKAAMNSFYKYWIAFEIRKLWIDKNIALVNGIEMLVDEDTAVVPTIKNDRTFVPVRFIVEALGFEIEWNAETKEVMVQDYNSSRSNRPTPIQPNDTNDDENSEDAEPGKAAIHEEGQEPGTKWSNKPSTIKPNDSNGEDEFEDEEPGKQEVQDYNSSRSNKPTPIKPNDPDEEGEYEDAAISEAQDYNSSRSNRPKPISDLNHGEEDEDEKTSLNFIWDSINKSYTFNLKGVILKIWIEKDIVLINEKQIKVNEKIPTVISNKTNGIDLGPIHFLSKVAGYTLEWNPKTKELTIIKG